MITEANINAFKAISIPYVDRDYMLAVFTDMRPGFLSLLLNSIINRRRGAELDDELEDVIVDPEEVRQFNAIPFSGNKKNRRAATFLKKARREVEGVERAADAGGPVGFLERLELIREAYRGKLILHSFR